MAVANQLLEQVRTLIADGDLGAYLDLHRQFHFGLYEMARIPILVSLIEGLWLCCGPTLSFVIPDYVRLLKGTDRHLRVIDALYRHDADAAEGAVVADSEEVGQYLLSIADERGRIRHPRPDTTRFALTGLTRANQAPGW